MPKLWFKAKEYGYGWYPVNLQGWLVILLSIILLILNALIFAKTNIILYITFLVIIITSLLFICVKKEKKQDGAGENSKLFNYFPLNFLKIKKLI